MTDGIQYLRPGNFRRETPQSFGVVVILGCTHARQTGEAFEIKKWLAQL
jgi:hypothetical protein